MKRFFKGKKVTDSPAEKNEVGPNAVTYLHLASSCGGSRSCGSEAVLVKSDCSLLQNITTSLVQPEAPPLGLKVLADGVEPTIEYVQLQWILSITLAYQDF